MNECTILTSRRNPPHTQPAQQSSTLRLRPTARFFPLPDFARMHLEFRGGPTCHPMLLRSILPLERYFTVIFTQMIHVHAFSIHSVKFRRFPCTPIFFPAGKQSLDAPRAQHDQCAPPRRAEALWTPSWRRASGRPPSRPYRPPAGR